MEENKTYGEQIKERREELGYSLRKLAADTGFSKTTIRDLEKGTRTPRKYALERIGKALGVQFDLTGVKTKLYLEVTPDRYSLPLAVAESAEELAEICGMTKENIFSRISEGKKLEYPTYITVEVEEGDDE